MKKYFLLLLVTMAAASMAAAEEMKFVTLLGQPKGIFQEVATVQNATVNGQLKIAGNKSGTLAAKNFTLQENTSIYGTLNVNSVAVPISLTSVNAQKDSPAIIRANNLQFDQNTATYKTQAASFANMTITGKANFQQSNGGLSNTGVHLGFVCLKNPVNKFEDSAPIVYVLREHSNTDEADECYDMSNPGSSGQQCRPVGPTIQYVNLYNDCHCPTEGAGSDPCASDLTTCLEVKLEMAVRPDPEMYECEKSGQKVGRPKEYYGMDPGSDPCNTEWLPSNSQTSHSESCQVEVYTCECTDGTLEPPVGGFVLP